MNAQEPLDYSYDLLYDLKTEGELSMEVEYLVNRLSGIMELRNGDGKSIDDYVFKALGFKK